MYVRAYVRSGCVDSEVRNRYSLLRSIDALEALMHWKHFPDVRMQDGGQRRHCSAISMHALLALAVLIISWINLARLASASEVCHLTSHI